MDFDDEILTVQAVQEHPEQVRVYALKAGVTSLTIVDENDAVTEIEVLIRGDVRHLESVIRRLYPDDAVQVEEISRQLAAYGLHNISGTKDQLIEILRKMIKIEREKCAKLSIADEAGSVAER